MSVGIVLSGGGAKGAYHVGVVKALAELGVKVDAVSGASIGALNGAILASSPDLRTAAQRLHAVWEELAVESPLQANMAGYFKMLSAAGASLKAPLFARLLSSSVKLLPGVGLPARVASHLLFDALVDKLLKLTGANEAEDSLLTTKPLKGLMDQYLCLDELRNGLPLYVSAYETEGIDTDLLALLVADLGFGDNKGSTFFHVQSLDLEQQKTALLASAAIPFLFAAQSLDGKQYTDGGQGGWRSVQGNTPIQPLLDAGYNSVIVTHLSDGSLWSRSQFPDATILEVRPQRSISRSDGFGGGLNDLLGFSADSIRSLIEQGYEDTVKCVQPVKSALEVQRCLAESEKEMLQAFEEGPESSRRMQEAMERLRKSRSASD